MRLYTRGGDEGETGLWRSGRVPKSHPRMEAIGDVDELNAHLGACVAQLRDFDESLAATLTRCQHDLFEIGAELADAKGERRMSPERVRELEAAIDALCAETPPLAHFVLPGGDPRAAQIHIARTVARRAERRVAALVHAHSITLNPALLAYLNRISDLLFAAARWVNCRAGVPEPRWPGDNRS